MSEWALSLWEFIFFKRQVGFSVSYSYNEPRCNCRTRRCLFMCHQLAFVFVSKVSMLRLWNTRISHLQYGMWAAKTRFGLCGDTTSQTHRWRFWLNTHIDLCSSGPAIQWVDDKLSCRKMTSSWWEEFCYSGNLLAGLSNIIPSKWNNLFWLSTVSCRRDKQNLQSWLTELQHFHRAIHFNQPVGQYFPFGFFYDGSQKQKSN